MSKTLNLRTIFQTIVLIVLPDVPAVGVLLTGISEINSSSDRQQDNAPAVDALFEVSMAITRLRPYFCLLALISY